MSCQQEGSSQLSDKSDSRGISSLDAEVNFRLGVNYWNGKECRVKNWKLSIEHLTTAEKLGHVEGGFRLGELYLELKRNLEGFAHIRNAAEKGWPAAQWKLAELWAHGHGCSRNESESRRWFSEAKQSGLDGDDAKMEKIISFGQELDSFEKERQLNFEDTTLTERVDFMATYKVVERIASLIKIVSPSASWLPVMVEKAKAGSFIAMNFFMAYYNIFQAEKLLSQGKHHESLKLHDVACRRFDYELEFNQEPFLKVAHQLLKKDPCDVYALLFIDRFGEGSISETTRMASRIVDLEPNVARYHVRLGYHYALSSQYGRALTCYKRAFEIFPDVFSLSHEAAALFEELMSSDRPQVLAKYVEFVTKNPPDHPEMPMCLYAIGLIYTMMDNVEKGIEYYKLGCAAEDIRLPCFMRIPNVGCKQLVLDCLHAKGACNRVLHTQRLAEERQSALNKAPAKAFLRISCGYCGQAEPTARCTACRVVRYCGVKCQKADWKFHKSVCYLRKSQY